MSNPQTELSVVASDIESATRELLQERQQLLVTFCRIAGLNPYTEEGERGDLLQEFCQVLMDYSALWLFEIQDRIMAGEGDHPAAKKEIERTHNYMVKASEVAVAFNDKYDATDHKLSFDNLTDNLSSLGEQLATRFEAEDRVLAKIENKAISG